MCKICEDVGNGHMVFHFEDKSGAVMVTGYCYGKEIEMSFTVFGGNPFGVNDPLNWKINYCPMCGRKVR